MRLARAALAVAAPLLFLALCEAILALAGVRPLTADPDQQEWLRFRRCQFERGLARSYCATDSLHSDRPRVVVALGGSTVTGYPLGKTVPFPAALQELLDARFPGEYQVFNRGRFCKDTIFVRECARAALEGRVETLVVYAGHNDYANWGFASPRRRIFLEENAWLLELDERLAHSRTYSWLVDQARGGRTPLQPARIAPRAEQAARARAVILEKTRTNLQSLIDAARETGTRVVLVTVVSNLHEFPVRVADWSDGPRRLAAGDERLAPWQSAFETGVRLYRAADFAGALTAFERARDVFQQGRAHSAHNELLRELAAAHPHVVLVDFELELRRRGAEPGIGCNYFGDSFPDEEYCDQFHPNTLVQRWIAEEVELALEELRDPTPPL
jgi:lysophospholipase L1-like esterase